MGKHKLVIHDRYSTTGTPRPNPKTVCLGKCEGMGFYPMKCNCRGEKIGHRPDSMSDWCFVNCADCGGTHEKRGTGRRL